MIPKDCCSGALEALLEPGLFRALSDPNRLTILATLASRPTPRSVTELATCCPVDLSVVSRHLAILRDAGVVEARRAGRAVLYSARCDVLARTLRTIADALDTCCPPAPSADPDDPNHSNNKEMSDDPNAR